MYLETVAGQSGECIVTFKLGKGLCNGRFQINGIQGQVFVFVLVKEEAGGIGEAVSRCSLVGETQSLQGAIAVNWHRKSVQTV